MTEEMVDDQTLRELILGQLAEHPAETLELAARLDQDPQVVLRVLKALEQEERVVRMPRLPWAYTVVE